MYPIYRYLTNKKYRISSISSQIEELTISSRIDLMNVTFAIPVKIDSLDRENNLNLTIDYLNYHFKTNIIVCEESNFSRLEYIRSKCEYLHYSTDITYTHRTKVLNLIAKTIKTPILAIWDTDAVVAVNQIVASYRALLEDRLDMVYPYHGVFLDLAQSFHHQLVSEAYNLNSLSASVFQSNHGNSIGGAIFFQTKVFVEGGMMNEYFKSYGWEDNELIERFFKLGCRIGRVDGVLVHLCHYRGENSSIKNVFASNNKQELQKVKQMSREQIKDYIKTFNWLE
jgi:N-terminal domain of galactosyltransferase